MKQKGEGIDEDNNCNEKNTLIIHGDLKRERKKSDVAQKKLSYGQKINVQKIFGVTGCFAVAFLTDLPLFNTMLNWVRSSNKREEAVGSEVMHHLTSTVGQPQPDTCVLCDSGILSNNPCVPELYRQVRLQYEHWNEADFSVNIRGLA